MISILTGMSTGKGAFDSDWEVRGAVWQEDSGEREQRWMGYVGQGRGFRQGESLVQCEATEERSIEHRSLCEVTGAADRRDGLAIDSISFMSLPRFICSSGAQRGVRGGR